MQATRQIRAMGVATPIVAVSSDSLPSDVQAFINAGANDFTPKVRIHRITLVLLLNHDACT
jgi:CheY-like chemotaxis protein